jgi:hypothetical protein
MNGEYGEAQRTAGKSSEIALVSKHLSMPQYASGVAHNPGFVDVSRNGKSPLVWSRSMWTGSEERIDVCCRSCMHGHASNFGHLFCRQLIGRMFLNCRRRIASSIQDREIGRISKVIVGMSVHSLDMCVPIIAYLSTKFSRDPVHL